MRRTSLLLLVLAGLYLSLGVAPVRADGPQGPDPSLEACLKAWTSHASYYSDHCKDWISVDPRLGEHVFLKKIREEAQDEEYFNLIKKKLDLKQEFHNRLTIKASDKQVLREALADTRYAYRDIRTNGGQSFSNLSVIEVWADGELVGRSLINLRGIIVGDNMGSSRACSENPAKQQGPSPAQIAFSGCSLWPGEFSKTNQGRELFQTLSPEGIIASSRYITSSSGRFGAWWRLIFFPIDVNCLRTDLRP